MTHLVEVVLRRGDNVTLQWSTAVRLSNLQGIQGEDVTAGVLATEILRLSTPAQLTLSRQDGSSNLRVDNLIHLSSIAGISITYDSQTLWNGLEDGKQRISLQSLLFVSA